MSRWPDDIAPARLRQPDRVSCGAATLVAARVVVDPDYRPSSPDEAIRDAHRDLTGVTAGDGSAQLPWPRALGTPPWTLAREIGALTGDHVRVGLARWRNERTYADLAERLTRRPVGVYIGSAVLPRHIVLALDATTDPQPTHGPVPESKPASASDDKSTPLPGAIRIFDPAHGVLRTVKRELWLADQLSLSGWSHTWAIV